MNADGSVTDAISRYHDVLARLADRKDVRADATKYEAIALALVSSGKASAGQVVKAFPKADSSLLLEDFFGKLYRQYDERFVYAAPALESVTRRLEWRLHSPIAEDVRLAGYTARLS